MKLDTQSYTVATALTATFLSMRASLPGIPTAAREADRADAFAGAKWLLQTITPDGMIPGYLDGKTEHGTNESIPYCTEAFVAAELLLPLAAHRAMVSSRLNSTVEFLVQTQRPEGGWYDPHSPRSLSLLQWYSQKVDPANELVNDAIARYFAYVRREGVAAFGRTELCCDVVNELGFLGLALADAIGPWASWQRILRSKDAFS